MNDVKEKIKQARRLGEIFELTRIIDNKIRRLGNQNWEAIKGDCVYIRLDEAIKDAETIIEELKEYFKVLKKIKSKNK